MKVMKKLWGVAGLLIVAAGIGFWARPVSYYNEANYLREFLSGVESRSVEVGGYRVHYLAEGPAGGRWWCWCTGWEGTPRSGATWHPGWSKQAIAFICPICPGLDAASNRPIFPTRSMTRP